MMPGPPTSRISDALLLALIGLAIMPTRAAAIDDTSQKSRFIEVCRYDRTTKRLIKEGTIPLFDPRGEIWSPFRGMLPQIPATDQEVRAFCESAALLPLKKPDPALVFFLAALAPEIKEVAALYHVDPRALTGVMLAENSLNHSITDVFQNQLALLATNAGAEELIKFTIGLGQINPSVVMKFEPYAARVEKRSPRNENEVIDEISTTSGSIRYAAAILASEQRRYENAGISVRDKPGILATLYNLGSRADLTETLASGRSPRVNYMGLFVENNLPTIERSLEGLAADIPVGQVSQSYTLTAPLEVSDRRFGIPARTLPAGTRVTIDGDSKIYTEHGWVGHTENTYEIIQGYENRAFANTLGRWSNCLPPEAGRCVPILQDIFKTEHPLRSGKDGTFYFARKQIPEPAKPSDFTWGSGACLDWFREVRSNPEFHQWMRQALSALDACEGVGSDGLLQNLRSSVYIVSEFEYDFYPEQMSKQVCC
ncbi:MAG: DUF1402 family protein [Bdellovibrionota bacterium]